MNKFELYQGDCLEVMPTIPAKSIDLGIVDPPYNIGKDIWDKFPSHEAYIEWMGKLFIEYQRVLKDNGSFYWFHSEMETIAELMLWIKKNTSFVLKQFIVWNKRFDEARNKGFLDGYVVVEGLRNYQQMAEYCLFYTFQDETGLTTVKLDMNNFSTLRQYFKDYQEALGLNKKQIIEIIGQSADHCFRWGSSQWDLPTAETYEELGKLPIQNEFVRQEYESLRYTFNNQKTHHSVWNYEIAKANGHATPKPPELIKNIIRHSSNDGDIILDACAGSGTTGEAAIRLNRYPIMIELGEENCEYIKLRCNKPQAEQPGIEFA